ncbi:hypothetical protein R2F25_18410 [Streptomyces sp. UP1A-1]|nr:hypothetical protein [Streptomyces sp. UP1A-1]
MAEGDGMVTRGIRIRLGQAARESDIGALHKWLEREKPLAELIRTDQLRIDERSRTDEARRADGHRHGHRRGGDRGAAGAIFQGVVDQVRRSVDAWRANRRQVEDGEPPEADVEPVRPDDR